jgi:acetyl esterase/lipase
MIVVLCFRIRPAGCGMRISDFRTRKLRGPTSTISQGSCAVIILTKIMALDFSHYGGPSEEWLAVEKLLPATPLIDTTMNPAVLRDTANAGRVVEKAPLMKELAPLVKMTDYVIPTRDGSAIEARTYRPVTKNETEKLPVYIFHHGGGFLFGNLDIGNEECARVAVNTGVVVLNVNYRHTPEHTFPTAWNDSQDAFVWLHASIAAVGGDPTKVLVGGTSAGGQLAASLALEKHLGNSEVLKGLPDLAGQILLIPCLANSYTYAQGPGKLLKRSSYEENGFAPLLSKTTIDFFMSLLKMPTLDLKDTKVNMVNATVDELRGLPPTVIGIAGMDPLRDEALLYAKSLAEANVPTEIRLFKGVPHGYRLFAQLKASKDWDECVNEGILWALERPKPTGKFHVKLP